MESIAKRPRSITVIAWSSILTGGFLVLGAFSEIVAWKFLKLLIIKLGESTVTQLYTPPTLLVNIGVSPFVYMLLLGALGLGVGILFLIVGIQFLRLRAWARSALEGISWLWLGYTVISGIWGIYQMATVGPTALFGKSVSIDTYTLKIFVVTATVVVTALQTILLIVIIKLLRGETIRNAVSHN